MQEDPITLLSRMQSLTQTAVAELKYIYDNDTSNKSTLDAVGLLAPILNKPDRTPQYLAGLTAELDIAAHNLAEYEVAARLANIADLAERIANA